MQNIDILALAGLRLDGRKYDDIRRIKLKVGVVDNADGSVYYEQGLNKVLITVHGPQEPIRKKGNEILTDKGSIEVNLHDAPYSGVERKKHRSSDRKIIEIENSVKETMNSVIMSELYPRSCINIVIHIFESDGSIICSILNAACIACMDAGIQMVDMIVSCSAGYVQSQLCQDLTKIEKDNGNAYIPIAIKVSSSLLYHCHYHYLCHIIIIIITRHHLKK
jgi:exosome complex component RRP41